MRCCSLRLSRSTRIRSRSSRSRSSRSRSSRCRWHWSCSRSRCMRAFSRRSWKASSRCSRSRCSRSLQAGGHQPRQQAAASANPPPHQDSAEAKGPLSARPWSALPGTCPGSEGHYSLHPLMVPGTISNLRQELRQAKPVPPLTVDAPSPGSHARAVSGVHAPSAPLFCQKTGCLSSPGPLTCGPDFWSSADQSDLVRTERCAEG